MLLAAMWLHVFTCPGEEDQQPRLHQKPPMFAVGSWKVAPGEIT